MKNTLSIAALALSLLATAGAEEPAFEQHGAHVHGQAELLIAVDSASVELEFGSPAANIVGFEHLPENDEQRQAVSKAVSTLLQPEVLFELSTAARCAPTESNVDTPLVQTDEGEQTHKGEAHEDHAEVHAHYRFECAQPESLQAIAVKLFERFPGTEQIIVTLISDEGQTQLPLAAESPRIPLNAQ